MNGQLTPRVMILAACIAGLMACDKGQKVEETQQDMAQQRQEAAKEQADLQREHAEERAELRNEAQRERANDQVAVPPITPPARGQARDERAEINQEAAELNRDQAEERARLNREQAKERKDLREDLTQAHKEAGDQRAEIVKDSREKLEDLDKRAAELRARVEQGKVEDPTQVNQALSGFPGQRRAVERDIEALDTVTAKNLNRAKNNVEKKLSSLDKTLDRAEAND